jgi:cleavage and polyadenylation specificity factor subunit 1
MSDETEATDGMAFHYLEDVAGYSTVVVTGKCPRLVIRESSSSLKVINLHGNEVSYVAGFNTTACERGFIAVDLSGAVRISQLKPNTRYGDTGWPTRKIPLGIEVQCVSYFPPRDLYVVGTREKTTFKLPEDENHREWSSEGTSFLPEIEQGSIRLVDPKTWQVLDVFALEHTEITLCMTAATLELSENAPGSRMLIAVGSLLIQGEDQAAQGRIHVIDVIDVVPVPNHPETGHKLHSLAIEEVKGAVSSIAGFDPQGYLLAANGQKVMVRGLTDESRLLPVAFLDVQCFVTVAKVLPGTGFVLLGDVMKGLTFGGFQVRFQ